MLQRMLPYVSHVAENLKPVAPYVSHVAENATLCKPCCRECYRAQAMHLQIHELLSDLSHFNNRFLVFLDLPVGIGVMDTGVTFCTSSAVS